MFRCSIAQFNVPLHFSGAPKLPKPIIPTKAAMSPHPLPHESSDCSPIVLFFYLYYFKKRVMTDEEFKCGDSSG